LRDKKTKKQPFLEWYKIVQITMYGLVKYFFSEIT